MKIEGPTLEELLRRLVDAPAEFVPGGSASSTGPDLHITAIVHDAVETLYPFSGRTDDDQGVDRQHLDRFDSSWRTNRTGETGRFALLLAWLVVDPWFITASRSSLMQEQVWSLFNTLAPALADGNLASAWHSDAQRREELVRTMLGSLDLRPFGETEAQAEDRLTRISSSQRRKVLAAAREAEQRAKAVREALAAKAAQEAADKYSRE